MLLYLNCMASRITGVHNFIANSSLNTHSSSVERCGMQQVLHAYLGADVPEDVKQGNALSDSDQAPVEQTSPIYTLACCKAREVICFSSVGCHCLPAWCITDSP